MTQQPECANLEVMTSEKKAAGYLTSRNPLILCDQDNQSRSSQASLKSQKMEKDRSCVLKTKCSFTKLKIIKR